MFFFLNLRDEYVNFILDSAESGKKRIDTRDFCKLLRKRFVEFWGPTPQKRNLYIKYEYSDDTWAEIKLDDAKHKYVNIFLSQNILNELKHAFSDIRPQLLGGKQDASSKLFNTAEAISSDRLRGELINRLRESAKNLFSFNKEILFIPAGRSLLSTLSDQLQFIHPHQLDYPMRVFIERINLTKSFFGKSIKDIIREKQALESTPVWFSAVRKVEALTKKVLKGEYIHDKEGGKIYVNNNTYTKISFASSGQQESIWILLSLFLVVLEKIDAQIFIEEPEAHLFPVAQKEIVELISFLSGATSSNFVITTHSPYILSAINNHIYASELGKKHTKEVDQVIPRESWLRKDRVNGYYVHEGVLTNLFDDDLCMFKTELIDLASEIVNEEYDKLFVIEREDISG